MLSPHPKNFCAIDPKEQAKLIVVIDTEEEFNWSLDFSPQNTSVKSMRSIGRIQAVFDEYRIRAVYVVDYPVVVDPEGYRPLEEIYKSDRCVIGAHLHPWVNPPLEEEVNRRNSFPGNLAPSLEAAKLRILGDLIGERFGSQPVIYKAGRYGIGPNTADILEDQGYEVDLSVCPYMDYSHEGGPNFIAYSAQPYWFGKKHRLLEIPLSVGFVGWLKPWGGLCSELVAQYPFNKLRLGGLLARTGLLDRIWLSPEGYTLTENLTLLRSLYRAGVRTFSFAFHSPSLEPGNTPYVTSQKELDRFIAHCRDFLDSFMGEFDGVPTTPLELKMHLSVGSNNHSQEGK
jgi:hypothetical protein